MTSTTMSDHPDIYTVHSSYLCIIIYIIVLLVRCGSHHWTASGCLYSSH